MYTRLAPYGLKKPDDCLSARLLHGKCVSIRTVTIDKGIVSSVDLLLTVTHC